MPEVYCKNENQSIVHKFLNLDSSVEKSEIQENLLGYIFYAGRAF